MPIVASAWSRAEIEALLAREDFKYQNIALPFGLETGGEDRSTTAAAILPDDLTGASLLDIGRNFGFFCFEAARRGAQRVRGVDVEVVLPNESMKCISVGDWEDRLARLENETTR